MIDILQSGHCVIEKENAGFGIHSSGKSQSGFLTSTQCKALLPNLSLVSGSEQSQVPFQSTLLDNFFIAIFIIRRAKEDIVLWSIRIRRRVLNFTHSDGFVEHPGFLCRICYPATARKIEPGVITQGSEMHFPCTNVRKNTVGYTETASLCQ